MWNVLIIRMYIWQLGFCVCVRRNALWLSDCSKKAWKKKCNKNQILSCLNLSSRKWNYYISTLMIVNGVLWNAKVKNWLPSYDGFRWKFKKFFFPFSSIESIVKQPVNISHLTSWWWSWIWFLWENLHIFFKIFIFHSVDRNNNNNDLERKFIIFYVRKVTLNVCLALWKIIFFVGIFFPLCSHILLFHLRKIFINDFLAA
jgi:hypothetical protein